MNINAPNFDKIFIISKLNRKSTDLQNKLTRIEVPKD